MLLFARTWMDIEGSYAVKKDRKGQILYDFTGMWNRKQKSNNELRKQNKNKFIDTDNRVLAYQRGRGGRKGEMGKGGH